MILVTGGFGFIGSNLVRRLRSQRAHVDIVVCDDEVRHYSGTLGQWKWIRGVDLFKWLETYKPSQVVHLAAVSDTTRTDQEVFETNFRMSVGLFEWCADNQVPFIYASSAATYGAGDYGFSEATPLHLLKPLNHYAWSKHCFDMWVDRQSRRFMPPVCIGLKFFNVFGPYEDHKSSMASIIHQCADAARWREQIQLFRSHRPGYLDGQEARDFIYVDDVCNAIEWFMEGHQARGIFNVGTGYARTFNDAMVALAAQFGTTPNIKYIPMPDQLRARYQYRTQADLTKLRAAGYTAPFLSLEEGIGRMFIQERAVA